jgi:Tol biopolymer transport system component
MRALPFTTSLLLATLVGCGGADNPTDPFPDPVVPALESVNFALLGSGKVAFERIGVEAGYGAIYVIDATAGTSAHYFDNTVEFGAAISPDGRRIAYTQYDDATLYDVFAANIDGTNPQHVTRFPAQDGAPTWTPDGTKIVVAGWPSNSLVYQVYSQSALNNPTDQTQLTNFSATPGVSFSCPVIIDNEVRVSISGQSLLAFACLTSEIDVLSSTGSLLASYKPSRADRSLWPNLFDAAWSPDGTRIAFIETTSNADASLLTSNYALKVMNADATNVTTLASVPLTAAANVHPGGGWIGPNNFSVCWMPDGSRLVFTIPETQLVGHLWVVRADGTGLTQLTSAPLVWDRSPSCSVS